MIVVCLFILNSIGANSMVFFDNIKSTFLLCTWQTNKKTKNQFSVIAPWVFVIEKVRRIYSNKIKRWKKVCHLTANKNPRSISIHRKITLIKVNRNREKKQQNTFRHKNYSNKRHAIYISIDKCCCLFLFSFVR